MRVFWGLALLATGCGEADPVYRVEFAIGFDDSVEFDLLGVAGLTDETPCDASGNLLLEGTFIAENTAVDRSGLRKNADGIVEVELQLTEGHYAFFAQGYDAAEVKNSQGCGEIEIAAGQTRELPVRMLPFSGATVCGDDVRAGFEQCDDGNLTPDDGCDADCVTEEQPANTNGIDSQQQPAIGVSVPFVVGFKSGNSINTRGLGPDASPRGAAWFGDQPVDGAEAGLIAYEQPAVGVGGTRYVVAYVEAEPIGGGAIEKDIRVTTVDWTEERDTTRSPGVAVHTPDDGIEQELPAVAVQDDGTFAVAWIQDGDVFAATFDANAGPVGAPAPLASGATGVSLAALDGTYVAAWDRGGAEAQRFDPSGAEVGGVITAGGSVTDVAVGVSFQRDEFALVWVEDSAVSFQAFGADGTSVAAAVPVSAGGTNTTPSVAGNAGHWFVVWGNSLDVWGRYLLSTGAFDIGPMAVGPSGPTDEAFLVNQITDGTQSVPVVAMNDILALVAWADSGGAGRGDDLDRGIRMRVLTEPAP